MQKEGELARSLEDTEGLNRRLWCVSCFWKERSSRIRTNDGSGIAYKKVHVKLIMAPGSRRDCRRHCEDQRENWPWMFGLEAADKLPRRVTSVAPKVSPTTRASLHRRVVLSSSLP